MRRPATIPRVAWIIFFAGIIWAAIYDTMYAMVDRDDDLKIGVKSSAIVFGDMDKLIIGMLQALMLFALYLVGTNMEFGYWYNVGLVGAGVFFAYQQWLIRDRKPRRLLQGLPQQSLRRVMRCSSASCCSTPSIPELAFPGMRGAAAEFESARAESRGESVRVSGGHIAIIGSGPTAWLAAATLARVLRGSCAIQVIETESEDATWGAVTTVPSLHRLLRLLGLDEVTLMRASDATYRLGAEFRDWGAHRRALLRGIRRHWHTLRCGAVSALLAARAPCRSVRAVREFLAGRPGSARRKIRSAASDPRSVLAAIRVRLAFRLGAT